MTAMGYSAYRIQWVLSFTEEDRAGGFCGTTTHHGPSPAVAAIASAETACRAIAEDVIDLRFFILGIVDENQTSVQLSNAEIWAALHRHASDLEFEVAYRPLC